MKNLFINKKTIKIINEIKYDIFYVLKYKENKNEIINFKNYWKKKIKENNMIAETNEKFIKKIKEIIKTKKNKKIFFLLPPTKIIRNQLKTNHIKKFLEKDFNFNFIEIESPKYILINKSESERKEILKKIYMKWKINKKKIINFDKDNIFFIDDVFKDGSTFEFLIKFLINKEIIKNNKNEISNNIKIIILSICEYGNFNKLL